VLMLTARDTLQDKLDGFGSGADDYLVKPFALEELLARCQALAQRHALHQPAVLSIGSLEVDRGVSQARRHGEVLKLSQTGFRILVLLAEAHPRVLTRSELIERLWRGEPPDSDALRTHLYQLRQVLDKPFAAPMLLTVHGVGYRLDGGA
jgi:DNA-binding response OmpR family regulator